MVQNRISAEQYDRVRKCYDERLTLEKRGFMGWLARRDTRAIVELLEPRPSLTALDAGCGDGRHARMLAAAGLRVSAMDLSAEALEKVRPFVAETIEANLDTFSLGRRFDRILCSGALEFVVDPARCLLRMADHLAPGGRLVLMGPRLSAGGRCYRAWHRRGNGIDVHLFSAAALTEVMTRSGLVKVGSRYPFFHSLVVAWQKPWAPTFVDG